MLSVSMIVGVVKNQCKARVIIFFILLANLFLLNGSASAETATNLVISEIQIAGATAGTEFIELYNPTSQQLDLSLMPLKLHIKNSTGTDNNKNLTFTNTTIPSYGFFLIAPAGSAFAAQADATYPTSGNMLVNNCGVYVSTSAISEAGVIDKVGFGSQPSGGCETASYPVNPAAGTSIERKARQLSTELSMNIGGEDDDKGNSWDSNDNSSDFIGRNVPMPQTSTSSAEQPVWDSDGPAVTINSPANAQIVSGIINISALVDDSLKGNSNIGEAFYSVDSGESVLMSAADGSFDSTNESVVSQLDSKNLSNGNHSIAITAKDIHSNFSTVSVEIIVENDLTPPQTTYSKSPNEPNGLNNFYVTVPSITLNTNEPCTTYYKWDNNSAYTQYISTLTAPQGSHTIYFYSVDLSGNEEVVKNIQIKTDTINPLSSIVIPKDNTYTKQNVLNIKTSIIEKESSVSVVRLYTDGIYKKSTSSYPFNFNLDVSDKKSGDRMKIKIIAIDEAGNQSSSSTLTVFFDRTKPKITCLSMKSKSVAGKTVKVSCKIKDQNSEFVNMKIKIVSLKTKKIVKVVNFSNIPTNIKSNLSFTADMSPGKYRVYFYATDMSGNEEETVRNKNLCINKKINS